MTLPSRPETAKIYQFPSRTSLKAGRYGGQATPESNLAATRMLPVEYGSGWYHEAAVQESLRPRKP